MEQAKIIPSNHGAPWTSDLETELIYAIATGKTVKDCEVCFQRTHGGITSRIMLIARRMVGKGIPIDAVSKTLNVSVSAINKSLCMSEISTENAQKRRDDKKVIVKPVKMNSDSSTQTTSYNMQFNTTFSREYLQGEFIRVKMEYLHRVVEQASGVVLRTAQQGGLHAMIDSSSIDQFIKQSGTYKITVEDIVEGLRLKCPGCKVQYEEKWEPSPRNPNQMDKKSGITVDWS